MNTVTKFLSIAMMVLLVSGLTTTRAHAASIVVNSNIDEVSSTSGDGNCTLREAIQNANTDSDTTGGDCTAGSGSDTITFSAPMSISAVNSFQIDMPIILNAESGGVGTCSPINPGVSITLAPLFPASNVFNINSDNVTIRGFRLIGTGVDLVDGIQINTNHVTIQCNTIGLNLAGNASAGFRDGVTMTDTGLHDITIGGPNPGDGNVISGNGVTGVGKPNAFTPSDGRGIMLNASNVIIQGNLIGTDITGMFGVPEQKNGARG
jgi:CSLREA domain-containing protein